MFEVLNQASIPNLSEMYEDQSDRTLIDMGDESKEEESEDESPGIDLMANDDEGDVRERN